jgi:uncharacterized metal-binding protein YceD (DUF177 family)
MKVSDQFSLPLKALKDGMSVFEYKLDGDFFQSFENELIGACEISQKVILDKRSEVIVLIFSHEGYMITDCDRCLEEIKLPLRGSKTFVVKFVEESQEDEEDIIYLLQDQDKFDLSSLINEVVTLSLPMVKTYDCENDVKSPCNPEVLKYLDREDISEDSSPVWAELKNLKLED